MRWVAPDAGALSEASSAGPLRMNSDQVPEIVTSRFVLRPLTEADVTERYLAWLRDADAGRYIESAAKTDGLADLRTYVRTRIDRHDVVFLGIFDKGTRQHIGNLKYEPVVSELGYAVMGVLIGEPAYRGRGVTGEILKATGAWLKASRNIAEIILGVQVQNVSAIRAYQKVGFAAMHTPYITPAPGAFTMVWRL